MLIHNLFEDPNISKPVVDSNTKRTTTGATGGLATDRSKEKTNNSALNLTSNSEYNELVASVRDKPHGGLSPDQALILQIARGLKSNNRLVKDLSQKNDVLKSIIRTIFNSDKTHQHSRIDVSAARDRVKILKDLQNIGNNKIRELTSTLGSINKQSSAWITNYPGNREVAATNKVIKSLVAAVQESPNKISAPMVKIVNNMLSLANDPSVDNKIRETVTDLLNSQNFRSAANSVIEFSMINLSKIDSSNQSDHDNKTNNLFSKIYDFLSKIDTDSKQGNTGGTLFATHDKPQAQVKDIMANIKALKDIIASFFQKFKKGNAQAASDGNINDAELEQKIKDILNNELSQQEVFHILKNTGQQLLDIDGYDWQQDNEHPLGKFTSKSKPEPKAPNGGAGVAGGAGGAGVTPGNNPTPWAGASADPNTVFRTTRATNSGDAAVGNSNMTDADQMNVSQDQTEIDDVNDFNKKNTDDGNRPLKEDKIYYNVLATTKKQLVEEFGLHRDKRGWYLHKGSSRRQILEAERAFGRKILNNK